MAHGYLCLWCGDRGPHDDWRHHTSLSHRVLWSDWQRCRVAAACISAVGALLCLGSVVLQGTGSPLLLLSWVLRMSVSLAPWLTPEQATLLWRIGLLCLTDAAALALSCWSLARLLAWRTARARWTAARREAHRLRRADNGRDA
jgi:hypothetical protein